MGKGEMVDGCSGTIIMLHGLRLPSEERERLVSTAKGQKKADV